MKKSIFVIALAVVFAACSVFAEGPLVITQTSGDITVYNSSDGTTGTSIKVGDFTVHSFSNGLSGSSYETDGITFHNFNNGVSWTTVESGGVTFHSFDKKPCGFSSVVDGNPE